MRNNNNKEAAAATTTTTITTTTTTRSAIYVGDVTYSSIPLRGIPSAKKLCWRRTTTDIIQDATSDDSSSWCNKCVFPRNKARSISWQMSFGGSSARSDYYYWLAVIFIIGWQWYWNDYYWLAGLLGETLALFYFHQDHSPDDDRNLVD